MRVVLWMLVALPLACGGMSGPAQLSVGGTYDTTVALLPGGTCGTPTVANNQTVIAQTPGSTSLTLTHAGFTYATTQVSIAGQFSAMGFSATVHVTQQQPACAYDVSWVGAKNGPPNVEPGYGG